MDNVSFQNPRGITIAGDLFTADSDACVILVHGFTGNRASKGRFDLLAKSLVLSGLNVFRFDFSGCGESGSDTISLRKEIDDLRSAVSFVRSRGMKRLALYGHSLGSLICLRCCMPEIKTMVLSGAMTGPMKYDLNAIYSSDQLREMNERGYLTVQDETGRARRVEGTIFQEFATVDQKELCTAVTCPVLIIHGNSVTDSEEQMLLARSRKALAFLPSGSRLEIIEGANHSLLEAYDRVVAITQVWYQQFLQRGSL